MSESYLELKVLMRSNTTFGTSDELIRVFSDQKASEVAENTAKGYGAHVIDILRMDGTPYREDDAPAQDCPAADSVANAAQGQRCETLTPLRQESVMGAEDFESTHTGRLEWVELIQQSRLERIDKLTYMTEAGLEYVLSEESPMGATFTYFASDFSNAEALTYLAQRAQSLMECLQQRRAQQLADYQNQHQAPAERG